MSKPYGNELIIDLHGCDATTFTRESITEFFESLCDRIKMKRADLYFWDYDDEEEKMADPPHLAGTTAVQFIYTSNIVIHTLDKLKSVYLNVFSCKEFDANTVIEFTKEWFGGYRVNHMEIDRI